MMLFRDDDINKYADVNLLMEIQGLFVKYNKVHTVTLEMEDLWENRALWYWLMMTPNLDVALHGLRHDDYSTFDYRTIQDHLGCALEYWEENSKRAGYKYKPITVFYPPWNKVSDDVHRACKDLGLEVNDCVDTAKVYNFHWWECIYKENLDKLEEMLKK